MSNIHFPNISEDQVLLIRRVLRTINENPDYLSSPKCPYTDLVKEFLAEQSRAGTGEGTDMFSEGNDVDVIDKQIKKLMSDLETYGQGLQSGDTSEKLQYFKTKNSLIEKLLTNLERAANLKQVNEFRSIVIQFMDEILTPDQITTFMQRIDGVLGGKT